MKITCKQAMSMLYRYLDNELDGISEQELERHVHDCRECFSRVDFEKKLREKVSQTGSVEAPEDVKERLKTLISKF